MRYTITFLEEDFELLKRHLFAGPNERAAYLLTRKSQTSRETRLLVREVLPVQDSDVDSSSPVHMSIRARSFIPILKRSHLEGCGFGFVHSHPNGPLGPSAQDDAEERTLFATAFNRIRLPTVHASVVFAAPDKPIGRVWKDDGTTAEVDVIRVVGHKLRYYFNPNKASPASNMCFDRQVRAFGPDIQQLLRRLTVGIVGAGGTGSSVLEQVVRLGVGRVLVSDGDDFEATNVNRVYGSRLIDDGLPKTKIAERAVADIGLETSVEIERRPITFQSAMKRFRDCDVIFGCSDDEWGRSILTSFAVQYHIPVFDMGVKITSENGEIRSVEGRVTTLMAGVACLFCRGRISADRIRAESMAAEDPESLERLRGEGYAPELEDRAPAVIAFTTSVAAAAVSEFLHRLTGFMGADRVSTEVLLLLDQVRVRTNHRMPGNCGCRDRKNWGRGDQPRFLGLSWRPE
jgi:hypothetical protein